MPIAKPRICSLGPSRAPAKESVTTRRPSTRSEGVITFILTILWRYVTNQTPGFADFFSSWFVCRRLPPSAVGQPHRAGLGFGGGLPAPAEGVEVDIPLRVNQPRARRRFPLLEIVLARGHCAPASASLLKTSPLRLWNGDGRDRHRSAATRERALSVEFLGHRFSSELVSSHQVRAEDLVDIRIERDNRAEMLLSRFDSFRLLWRLLRRPIRRF